MDNFVALSVFMYLVFVYGTSGQTVTVSLPASAPDGMIELGNSISITCTVTGGPVDPSNIQWIDNTGCIVVTLYNGDSRFSQLAKYSNFNITSLSGTESVMTIHSADVGDDGDYKCAIPTDPNASPENIEVEAPGNATTTICSSVNGNGEDMYEAMCDVVGSKPQIDIIWNLNGVTQTDGNGNTIEQTHPTATPPLSNTRSVFTFPATQENFGQTLVCQATGYQLPDIDLHKSRVLDIHSSPSTAGTTVITDYVTHETDIRVTCTAENEPSPTMRNYYIFSNDTLIHESMNSVKEVTVSNPVVGIKYTCMAGNYLGNTSLSAAVVYDPTGPASLTPTTGTPTEIDDQTVKSTEGPASLTPTTGTQTEIDDQTLKSTEVPGAASLTPTTGKPTEIDDQTLKSTEGTASLTPTTGTPTGIDDQTLKSTEETTPEPTPCPCAPSGLNSGAYAGISILAILLVASIITNIIQFILLRRKIKPEFDVSQKDDKRNEIHIPQEVNDNVAYEMIQSGDRELKLDSSHIFVIARENVTFFTRLGSIGRGDFGEVWKGDLRSKQNHVDVAIRQIPDRVAKSLQVLQAIKILHKLSDQPNVVKCLGYCKEQGSILYEFISGGTLLTHLQTSGVQSQPTYSNLKPNGVRIEEGTLLNFAWQVAKGMQFLATKKIIHGTLCAHNVLLGDRKQCKISDYGLSSSLFSDQGKATRWSSPETMVTSDPTTEGDIWSFGIVLWEIVMLGARPYPNMTFTTVQTEVANGYQMPRPRHCAQEVYAVMTDCWAKDPTNRTNFDRILKDLERILEKTHSYLSLNDLDERLYASTSDM